MSVTPKKGSLIILVPGQEEKMDKSKNSEMWEYLLHFRLPNCGHIRMSLRMYLKMEEADRQRERQTLGLSNLALFMQLKAQIPHTTIASHTGIQYNCTHTHIVICFCFPQPRVCGSSPTSSSCVIVLLPSPVAECEVLSPLK